MYRYKIKPTLAKILQKLEKKDKKLYYQVLNKIEEIISSSEIEHYKNLRYSMKNFKRVHINPFVLTFHFDKEERLITFEDFYHHDTIYRK